eukprot:gene11782-13002_t
MENKDYSNFLIGGYFGAHSSNQSTSNYCGKINRHGLIQLEAMRYTISKVNRMNNILFGRRVWYRITDSCYNTGTLRRAFFKQRGYYFMGSVGPPTSGEATILATVQSASRSAVISPTASSSVFEDRFTYYNFFRTIPSDVLQVDALVSLCARFNWTYVSVVNSNGVYGQHLLEAFNSAAERSGICIAKRKQLPRVSGKADYDKVIAALDSDKKVNVVLLFTSTVDTKALLKSAHKIERFTWLATTSWRVSEEFTRDIKKTAKGAFILQYTNPRDKGFEEYFLNLTLRKNNYTWFREFWSNEFQCNGGIKNDLRPRCTGDERLNAKELSIENVPVAPVISAVETFVCALRRSIIKLCPTLSKTCIVNYLRYTYNFEKNVILYLQQGDNTSVCQNLTNSVSFNKQGYFYRGMRILNFNGVSYNSIGDWSFDKSADIGSLNISVENITWMGQKMPTSLCSLPCNRDEIQLSDLTRPSCCFTCEKCSPNSIVLNNTCNSCHRYELADLTTMRCRKMPFVAIEFNQDFSALTMGISFLGIILNTFMTALFVKNRKLRVVKASSRELSFVILMALYLCFVCPFTFLAAPSKITCGAQRFIVGLSLTGCYTPLMLKTNRIYRIFKAAQVFRTRPLLVSPKSQMLICIGLLGLQLLLGIMWVVAEPPYIEKILFREGTAVAEVCKFDTFNFVLNLLPCLVIMAVCTVFAFKTRKFPSNFNEAQSIVITMYLSCFLWGIFVPLIILVESMKGSGPFRLTFIVANFPNIIGLVTLSGLFGPKIRQILCVNTASVHPKTEMLSRFQEETVTVPGGQIATDKSQGLYTISEIKIASESGLSTVKTETKDTGTDP